MNIARFVEFPVAGLPSVGVRNSAFFLYFLAIPNLVVCHPLSGVVWVALINVLVVFQSYLLAEFLFGRTAGRICGILVAFSPWMIMYARNMWPPSCVAFLSLWLLYLTFRWLESGGGRRLTLITLLGFLIPQMHFSGFCAPVWILVALWTGRANLKLAPICLGVLLGACTLMPWFLFQHAENHWIDINQAMQAAKGKHTVVETVTNAARAYQNLLHSGGFDYWFGLGPAEAPELFPKWLRIACLMTGTMLALLFLAAFLWSCRTRERSLRLLALWAAMPMFMLALVRPDIHPHYVLVAFPVPFLLIAAMVGRWIDAGGVARSTLTACLLVGLVICNLLFLNGWRKYVDEGRTNGEGHFELSYRQRLATSLSVLEDMPDRLIGIAGAFSGLQPAYYYLYNFEAIRQGRDQTPIDESRQYWIDEVARDERPDFAWKIEKSWRVGPSRIYRIHKP